MVVGLKLPMQSVPITTNVVSSNLDQGEVIKFVGDLRQVGEFFPVLQGSSTIKADRHDISKILLKVALNTIRP
jgi:hypothetical protein